MPLYLCSEPNDEAFRASLVIAFKGQSIECFGNGGSLRNAIEKCEACLCIAKSVNSPSTWLELGAFYFANIRIFFLLSGDVTEKGFPQFLVQDNLISRDLGQLISEIKKEISEVSGKRYAAEQKRKSELLEKPRLVSDLTIEMFFNVLSSSIKPQESIVHTMILLREAFLEKFNYSEESIFDNASELFAFATPLLKSLIGTSQDQIKIMGQRYWLQSFELITDSGNWYGFCQDTEAGFPQTGFENVILLHFDKELRCDGSFLSTSVGYQTDQDGDSRIAYGSIIGSAGSVALGVPLELKPDKIFPWNTINLLSAG